MTLQPVFRDFFPDLSVCVQPSLQMTKHEQCCNAFVESTSHLNKSVKYCLEIHNCPILLTGTQDLRDAE